MKFLGGEITFGKITNPSFLFEETRGFYFLIIVCLIFFISLLFALPHLFPKVDKTNQLQAQLGLHVQGNQLIDGEGQLVLLHGVDRSGTEYECVQNANQIFDGPNNEASILAMKSWKINVVRVPLNEDCWFGINGAKISADTYRHAIGNYVALLTQYQMYVILDLHWNAPGTTLATGTQRMADRDHSLDFWTSVANSFKDQQNVIFDLYNEPRNISWSCWKDGTGCIAAFPIASMQDMVTAVRQTGAKNVLMLGGLDFANDLSGWLENKPMDPLNNLAASWHMYGKNACDNVKCWNETVAPVMAKVPVITGEFGESYNSSVCGTKTSSAFLQWMDKHHSGYLAWTWDAWSTKCEDLSLITDYSGMPKLPNGINYKAHLDEF